MMQSDLATKRLLFNSVFIMTEKTFDKPKTDMLGVEVLDFFSYKAEISWVYWQSLS